MTNKQLLEEIISSIEAHQKDETFSQKNVTLLLIKWFAQEAVKEIDSIMKEYGSTHS